MKFFSNLKKILFVKVTHLHVSDVFFVYGYPMKDLVVRLPGQPKVDFRQFAGYITVDENTGKSLFYYYAEAEKDAAKMPFIL